MPEPTKAAFSLGDFGDQFENKDDAMRFEPPRSGDLLMSSSTADLSANAFAALASLHDDPEPEAMAPRRSASGDMGALTVEELVREVLKPLLKDWLDQNLPPMVEQLVRGEIERVASSGRRR
jgi:cell pole-organizing protein PopZ